MTDITLSPCPFCEGPPKPIVTSARSGGVIFEKDDYGDGGVFGYGYVFCHECGATGPSVDDWIYSREDWHRLRLGGIENWQRRDARHRELYDVNLATMQEEM